MSDADGSAGDTPNSETPTDAVEAFVRDHQPVEQDEVVAEFGNRGLAALKVLMRRNVVSYDAKWRIIHEG